MCSTIEHPAFVGCAESSVKAANRRCYCLDSEPPSMKRAQVLGVLGRATELMHINVLCKLGSALLMERIVKNSLKTVRNRRRNTSGQPSHKCSHPPRENMKREPRKQCIEAQTHTSTCGSICQPAVRPAVPAWPLGHIRMKKWPWEQPPFLEGVT